MGSYRSETIKRPMFQVLALCQIESHSNLQNGVPTLQCYHYVPDPNQSLFVFSHGTVTALIYFGTQIIIFH